MVKISIFVKNLDLSQKFSSLSKIAVFVKKFQVCQKFSSLSKNFKFLKNFAPCSIFLGENRKVPSKIEKFLQKSKLYIEIFDKYRIFLNTYPHF